MTVIIRDSVKGKLRQTIAPAVAPLCSPVQGYLQSDIQTKLHIQDVLNILFLPTKMLLSMRSPRVTEFRFRCVNRVRVGGH